MRQARETPDFTAGTTACAIYRDPGVTRRIQDPFDPRYGVTQSQGDAPASVGQQRATRPRQRGLNDPFDPGHDKPDGR
jgi:hypothetical protein